MNVIHPALTDVHIWMLVFVRIAAMLAMMPVFGTQSVPIHAKAGLAVILAIVLTPFVEASAIAQPRNLYEMAGRIILEVAVGLVIGFVSSFLFTALQFAGRLIDTQMGFAMVQLVDPFTESPTTSMGQFQVIIFTIVFLLIQGHYFLLLAIEESFELIPLLQVDYPGGKIVSHINQMVGAIFTTAIKVAAPVFVTLVLTSVTLGVVARTVPQMNIFFVGLPLKIGVGIFTMIVVLPLLAQFFKIMTNRLFEDIWRLLYLLA